MSLKMKTTKCENTFKIVVFPTEANYMLFDKKLLYKLPSSRQPKI